MFRAVHIVEELGGGGGTRIRQALIVIIILFLLQRTKKPQSAEKNVSVNVWGDFKVNFPPKFFSEFLEAMIAIFFVNEGTHNKSMFTN